MASIDLNLFGELSIIIDGRQVTEFPTEKTRALLAYLAVESARPHSRVVLAGLLWPDVPDQQARTNLRNTLYRLRKTLDDAVPGASSTFLKISSHSLTFHPSQIMVDVLAFQARMEAVAAHVHPSLAACDECLANLTAAAGLYRGDLLRGLSLPDAPDFEEWLLLRREYLSLLAIQALADLTNVLEARRQYAQAHAYGSRLLALDQFREETHRQIMRLLAHQGMTERALAQFQGLRKLLREEMGVEPDEQTSDLVRQISVGDFGRTAAPVPVPVLPSDWIDAPLVGPFFGRTAEAAQLQKWLVEDRCQLVALLGMGGVGKSTLATHVARAVSGHFDAVIWRSLLNGSLLSDLLPSIIEVLSDEPVDGMPANLDEQLSLLLDQLRQRRCLLVLDNFETILQAEQAGHYRPGYENYGQLLQRLGAYEHESCLLLTSRERPLAVARLERNSNGVRSMPMAGLDVEASRCVLEEHGLAVSPQAAEALTRRYSGNPLALTLVAQSIQDLFHGDVDAFLAEETPIFGDIRDVLEQQISRLAPLEQDIMVWLAIGRQPVAPATLRGDMVGAPSTGDLLDAMRGLQNRSLLEKMGEGFGLQNVVTEYLTDRLVDQICREVLDGRIDALDRFALLHTRVSEVVRQSQRRLILDPIARRLATTQRSPGIAALLRAMLDALRAGALHGPGYAAGNILNLLLHAEVDLTGFDFSRLDLRQADLQGTRLPQVSFIRTAFSGCTFTDTSNVITSVAFSPDGRLIAAGSADNKIRLWRMADGMLATMLTGHDFVVTSIAFSPDGSMLASGSIDATVRLWDIVGSRSASGSGHVRAVLRDHEGSLQAVAFSPDGRTLASGSRDATIRLWDVAAILAAGGGNAFEVLQGHSLLVLGLDFSPDGRLLASAGADQVIRLWDMTDARPSTERASIVLDGHSDRVTSVTFSPGGKTLASASNDGSVRLWDAASGRCLHVLNRHRNWVLSVAFDPTGRMVASGSIDRSILIWDLFDEQMLAGERPPYARQDHSDWVRSVAFSPDGHILASGGDDKSVRLWDVRTRQLLRLHQGFKNRVLSVAFSPDGATLASASEDGKARLWRIDAPAMQYELPAGGQRSVAGQLKSVAFSPSGDLLATGGGRSPVNIWDARSGRLRSTLRGHLGRIVCVVFSPDGRFVAAGGEDRSVYVWSLNQHRSGGLPRIMRIHEQAVVSLAFSPDSTLLASGSADRNVCLWDVATGQVRNTLTGHSNWVNGVAFSSDGGRLASACADGIVRLFDVASGALLKEMEGHVAWVRTVAFGPGDRTLASGGNDFTVRLWDLQTGKTRQVLEGHDDMVWSVAFSPDGRTLASGSGDETIRLWDPDTGHCVATWRLPGPYQEMDITASTGITEAQRAALVALGAVDGALEAPATL
ncbi:MAG: BTAD domain-containing putative transcriptional regulator [Caldilineales bacterium]